MVVALLIFVATYVLIAGRGLAILPIGRPAGALLGAAAMVGYGAFDHARGLSPSEALGAVELNTVGLLFGMMILASGVHEARIFARVSDLVIGVNLSPRHLLAGVTIVSGLLSALLLNDSVCLIGAPFVDRIARARRLPRVPYLLALAMGSNAGSAMTLAGNPQNMLVAKLGGLQYRAYLLEGGVAGLVGLLATALVLDVMLRSEIGQGASPVEAPAPPSVPRGPLPLHPAVPLAILAAVSALFVAGASLAWTAIAGAALMMAVRRRDAAALFDSVSWTVLVFFGSLFVIVAGLEKAGVPQALFHPVIARMPTEGIIAIVALSAVLLVGCQIISNVPFILLVQPLVASFSDGKLAWTLVAIVATFAGNFTLLGSAANVLVVETAHAEKEIGFRRYGKVGVPVALAGMSAAVATLLVLHRS